MGQFSTDVRADRPAGRDAMYRPDSLTILTTDRCTAVCDHCSVMSDKIRSDRLSAEQMIDAIRETHALGGLTTVIFAGGEPRPSPTPTP